MTYLPEEVRDRHLLHVPLKQVRADVRVGEEKGRVEAAK